MRPFRRLAFRIFRPLLVAIRALKPCLLARDFLLGWYVLFISTPSSLRAMAPP